MCSKILHDCYSCYYMGILCQLVPYLPMCSGCISNMTAGADPGFSWRPPKTKTGFPQYKKAPQLINPSCSASSLSFFFYYFPLQLTGALQCKFWFGQFGLLLSVSQAGLTNCCLLQLHPWGGVGECHCSPPSISVDQA